MLELKAGPMREHDYTTLFKLEHMLKDVRLCLEEGQALGVPFPAAADVREVLTAAMGRGHGDDDFAAMIEVLEGAGRASGSEPPAVDLLTQRSFCAVPGAAKTAWIAGDIWQFGASPIQSRSPVADVAPAARTGQVRKHQPPSPLYY